MPRISKHAMDRSLLHWPEESPRDIAFRVWGGLTINPDLARELLGRKAHPDQTGVYIYSRKDRDRGGLFVVVAGWVVTYLRLGFQQLQILDPILEPSTKKAPKKAVRAPAKAPTPEELFRGWCTSQGLWSPWSKLKNPQRKEVIRLWAEGEYKVHPSRGGYIFGETLELAL